jgi:hypothetical protein
VETGNGRYSRDPRTDEWNDRILGGNLHDVAQSRSGPFFFVDLSRVMSWLDMAAGSKVLSEFTITQRRRAICRQKVPGGQMNWLVKKDLIVYCILI